MSLFHCLLKRTSFTILFAALVSLFILNSCGGGAAAIAGVGSGGTGVGSGTIVQGLVTGFGSIFIDGTEYVVGSNTQVKEQFDGSSQTGLFSLGQVVTATIDNTNTVVSAEISPDLQGVITYKPVGFATGTNGTCLTTTDYYVYVLNQKVRIVTQACNTPLGVTTIFNEPYALCTASNNCSTTSINGLPSYVGGLVSGSEVKVHGFWIINPLNNLPELVATRIDQYYIPSTASGVYNAQAIGINQNLSANVYELSGIVTSITSSNIAINGGNGTNGNNGGSLVTAASLPTSLSVNQVVSMNVNKTDWFNYFGNTYDTSITPTTILPVNALTINSATSFTSTANPNLQVSGIISYLNGNIATVNGTQVVLPTTCSNCAVGDYIRVKGTGTNSQGELESSNIEYSANSQITLKGVLVFPTITSNTATVVFQGTSVFVPSTVMSSNCVSNSSQYVVVTANYAAGSLLTANSISCTSVTTTNLQNSAVDYVGSTSNYSSNSSQFTLNVNGTVYTVNYNSNTYIEKDLNSASPTTQYIEVVGQVTGTNTISASALKVAENNSPRSNSD
jgi:hypothetical protein